MGRINREMEAMRNAQADKRTDAERAEDATASEVHAALMEAGWYGELSAVEDRHSLIVLAYSKGDADGMMIDEKDGEPVLANLTDEEWDRVRDRFDDAADHIRQQIWDLIEDLAREEKGPR